METILSYMFFALLCV